MCRPAWPGLGLILLLDNGGLMLERMHWTVQQSARGCLQCSSLEVHNCLLENKTLSRCPSPPSTVLVLGQRSAIVVLMDTDSKQALSQ